MALNKDEIQKLSPEARLKKLKELGEERKKDTEEADDLIKRAVAEIEREKSIPKIEVPDLKPVDISKMFEAAEGLEMTVRKEAPFVEEQAPIKYNAVVEQASSIYTGYEDEDDIKRETTIKFESTVKYESTVQQVDDLTASRSTLKNLKKYTMG